MNKMLDFCIENHAKKRWRKHLMIIEIICFDRCLTKALRNGDFAAERIFPARIHAGKNIRK